MTVKNFKSFTSYVPAADLVRAEKLAKKALVSQSAIVRQAIRLGLDALERQNKKVSPK